MSILKQHQKAYTIHEQIINLKEKGLIIQDENYAVQILSDISYFRLIKAFSLGLKEKNGNYYENITFEKIVNLYLFNSNFRQILFPQIEKIEINLRARVSNYFSEKYGVLGYLDPANFTNKDYHSKFIEDINIEIKRNAKSPFVKNFRGNYESGNLPLYALLEIVSFGSLSKLYKNMKNDDKKNIALTFNVPYTYLESWMECISYLRNICAHYGRIYNARLVKTPQLYKEHTKLGVKNNKIFGILVCMKELLSNDNKKWKQFVGEIVMLTEKYEEVELNTMGFPGNWQEILNS